MITLGNLKAGTFELGQPIYKSKPYLILSDENVVLFAGTLEQIKAQSSYYDACKVAVRDNDMHANDNAKIEKATALDQVMRELGVTGACMTNTEFAQWLNSKGGLYKQARVEYAALVAVTEAAAHWEVCDYPNEIDFRCDGCCKAKEAYKNLAAIRAQNGGAK